MSAADVGRVLFFGPASELRARSRFDHRLTCSTQRTRLRLIRRDRERGQRVIRHIEALLTAAAVDNRRGPNDLRAGCARHVNRLARRSSGRHDVLDDQHLLARRERKSPAKHQLAVLPLGKDGPDSEGTTDLLPDDNSAKRRRKDDLRAQTFDPLGNVRPAGLGMRRMLQNQRALQIPRTVKAGGQPKMPLEQSP